MEPCIKNHRHKWIWTNNTSDGRNECYYCSRCNQQMNKEKKGLGHVDPDQWFYRPEENIYWGPSFAYATSYIAEGGAGGNGAVSMTVPDGMPLFSRSHTPPETYDNTIATEYSREQYESYVNQVREMNERVDEQQREYQSNLANQLRRTVDLELMSRYV